MEELKAQAEALGLKVDGRWSEERLRAEIDTAASAATNTMPVRLMHDVWFDADERTPAGAVVRVPVADAKSLIGAGKAVRADPLPGEAA